MPDTLLAQAEISINGAVVTQEFHASIEEIVREYEKDHTDPALARHG